MASKTVPRALRFMWIFLRRFEGIVGWSKCCGLQCVFTLSTPSVDILHSLSGPADTTAAPVEWSDAGVSRLCLPLTICRKEMHRQSLSPKQITPSITEKLASIMFQIEIIFDATNWMNCCVWVRKWWFHSWFKELPQVPQQSLRSSMCSTSTPISHDPSETSSFAYLWSTCLKMIIWLNPRYSVRTGNLPFNGKHILVYRYVSCQIFRNSV